MLNTQKLLYILPDVAYIAELLPTKKEHTFSIHSFRQINGAFLDDDNFIAENVEKLVAKIEPEEYHLILPDFLFTNTIVQVQETSESKATQYIKETLLPNIEISPDTHEIDISVLTQHQGKFKIQLSALEKEVLDPIVRSARPHQVMIKGVSPVSWTIKSVISLEPSISVIQVGSMLYSALHYIGVDQTTSTSVDELENVIETIKTLKGGEPSIQTVYLLTNALVEEKLKDTLSGTLPIQQLATFKEDETQMPSYVKQIIESGMKTLDISDFPVPRFALPATPVSSTLAITEEVKGADVEEVSTTDLPAPTPAPTIEDDETDEEADELLWDTDDEEDETAESDSSAKTPELEAGEESEALPAPTEPPSLPSPTPVGTVAAAATTAITEVASVSAVTVATTSESTPADATVDQTPDEKDQPSVEPVTERVTVTEVTTEKTEVKTEPSPTAPVENDQDRMLSQFTATAAAPVATTSSAVKPPVPPAETPTPRPSLNTDSATSKTVTSSKNSGIIKNRNSVSPMLRMIFITLAVFAVTVAVGVGIGLGVLSFSKKDDFPESPVVSPSTTPAPSSTPSLTPSPTASASAQTSAQKAALKILVVNATTIPGHAGKTKTALESAGYKGVAAGNAKGEYEAGTYVLLKDANSGLASTLSTDSKLDLTVKEGIAVEDPRGQYDAVIVLAE